MTIKVELATTPALGDTMIVDVGEVDTATVQGDPTWVDVSADVTSFSCRRGRNRSTAAVNAGGAQLTLNNHDGEWSPIGEADGTYSDQLEIGRRLRVSYTVGGTDYPMFNGTIERYEFTQQASAVFLDITLEDNLAVLGRTTTASVSSVGAGETVGARLSRVLDAAGSTVDRSVMNTGMSVVAYEGGVNAASYAQLAALSADGVFFAAADGTLTFLERNRTRTVAVGVTDVTSSETTSTAASINIPLAASSDTLVTSVTATAESPLTSTTETDLQATALYGPRTLSRQTLAQDQADVDGLASWLLAGRSTPDLTFRESSFLLEAKGNTLAAALLGVEVGDMVTVEWTPPTDASATSRYAQVEQVQVRARPGRTTLQWVLSDQTNRTALQVDSNDFGLVGSGITGWD